MIIICLLLVKNKFKGGDLMKKLIIAIMVIFVLAAAFTGCTNDRNQTTGSPLVSPIVSPMTSPDVDLSPNAPMSPLPTIDTSPGTNLSPGLSPGTSPS